MITCICHNVSDKRIKEVLKVFPDIHTLKELKRHIDICSQCGKCKQEVKDIIHSLNPVIVIDEAHKTHEENKA